MPQNAFMCFTWIAEQDISIRDIFCISQFEKFDWLAGLETANQLHCWSILSFSNKHEVRNKQGFSDLNHMSFAQQKHPKSRTSALLSAVTSIW
jgi:hypothetical protein